MTRPRFIGIALFGAAVAAFAGVLLWPALQPLPPLRASGLPGPERCAPGSRPGPAGRDDSLVTAEGLAVSVRTPLDHDPRRAQPLLVVFPPAGFGRRASEHFYALTEAATARGWIVAYPAAVPLSARALALQQAVAGAVAARWCVDLDRLGFVGHSDGASVAEGLLLRADPSAPRPRHLLASAAGLRGADLAREACPAPTDLTLVHGAGDRHFPGYGLEAARWWAACWRCAGRTALDAPLEEGRCIDLGPCQAGGALRYCAAAGPHEAWPAVAADPFRFFTPATPPDGRP